MTIDLSGNAISGGIPASMHLLQKLRVLNMGKNQLDGSIPPSIGNLSLLSHLDVNTNNLTGEIPEAMGRLDHIQHLQLSITVGVVPNSLQDIGRASDGAERRPVAGGLGRSVSRHRRVTQNS